MKVIIAGCRDFNNFTIVDTWVHYYLSDVLVQSGPVTVVSGGAQGVDALGERWAKANGCGVVVFKADWNKHGKAAGPVRNREMARYADCLIAFWDGQSRGTKSMIELMRQEGKPVRVVDISKAE